MRPKISFLGFLSLCSIMGTFAYRLPTAVVPQHYTVNILTNLGDENDKFEFYGNVTIKATVVESTKNITLHTKELDIDVAKIAINDGTDAVETTQIDKENEFFTIQLKAPLEKDKPLKIFMEFKGKLEDGLAGYYRSFYVDKETKKKHYLAVTQFESTDARRAFPCFDEPEMKAKFTISLGHCDKYTALSNMNEIKKEPIADKSGWSWTHFEETVPMSTYLVAFMVSDFSQETAPMTHSNVTFRIWARKDALKQVQLAKEVGPKALSYFENFFDIAYPLPKQDMVAIPDFNAGAMENWGLITYRETALLYDPEVSSSSSQQSISSTISHELAHQWFGNLVTMKWWTDLWLNEGFATYMAALAVDHLHPEWNYLKEEAVNNILTVFDFDSLKSSHQISVPVGHPREIAQIFDTISYRKGSYILRMMSLFLGEETLRQGVSNYLKKHRYQNAEQDDLWASLTEEAHKNKVLPANLTVKTIMDTWTLQTGYPVLSVNRNYNDNKAEVSQKRFLRDVVLSKSVSEQWWVPLTYTNSKELKFDSATPKHFLPNTGESLVIDAPEPEDFLLFNIDIAGLYRINYDEKNWKLLSDYLRSEKFEQIPVVNRIQLLEDSSALGWTGDLSYEVFFDILSYLPKEQGFLPWKAALSSLGDIHNQMKRTSDYGLFKKYMQKFLAPIYPLLGNVIKPLTDEKTSKGLQKIKLQAQIANTACKFGVAECINDMKKLYSEYMKDPVKNALPKNLRGIITCNAIRFGGEEEWNFQWQEYLNSNVATVKESILSSLGCTAEPWLLRRYLEWSLQEDSGIRKQDFLSVFRSVARNQYGFHIAKDFLESEIERISKFLYPNARRLTRCLSTLASPMITKTEYDWLEKLTTEHAEAFKDAQQGVVQALETVQLNLQWQKLHHNNVKKLLEKRI